MTLIRIGVCALIAYTILAFGAVDTISVTILEIGAVVLFLWWALGFALGTTTEIQWAPVLWPLAALVLIALLQLVAHITLYPYLTKLELMAFTSYVLMAFLFLQSFRTARHWRIFAWFLIWLGFLVSIFGIIQSLTFNEKIYWLRAMPHGGIPFGPFVNRNHFAGCMELLIPIGLAMVAQRAMRRQQMPLVIWLAVVPMGALVLSASRAGIGAFGVELVALIFLLAISGGEHKQLAIGIVVVGLALALVAWLGLGPILARFSTVTSQEVSVSRRIDLARGGLRIFRDHPIIGTGLGTTISVFPKYEREFDGKVIDHLHDDHLEMLAETGIVGGLCWLAFILCILWFGYQRFTQTHDPLLRAMHLGALVGCVGLMVHGFLDFNLHIPSNALLFYVLSAAACARPEEPPPQRRRAEAPSFSQRAV